jgi:HSP20 family protein
MTTLTRDFRSTLERVRERIDTLLDRPQRDDQERGIERRDGRTGVRPFDFAVPDVDVEETKDAIVVRAELPGLNPDDVTVEATPTQLTLRGEKREEREEQQGTLHRVERRYGAFLRRIDLPCEVDPNPSDARFRNGVLRVRLPKTEEAKSSQRRITVRAD